MLTVARVDGRRGEAGLPEDDSQVARLTAVRARSAHLPAHMVPRARLVEALDAPGARVVVVTGPAGSGKTVAVRDWRDRAEAPTAWLSLERRHTDPEHFLDDVLGALDQIAPGLRAAVDQEDGGEQRTLAALAAALEQVASVPG